MTDYRRFTDADFRAWFNAAKTRVETVYHVHVTERLLQPPNTSLFDGESISIDETLDSEMKLFVLLHVFGHTVQWCLSPQARRLGLRQFQPGGIDASAMSQIHQYETAATRYGLQLLHESGERQLDGWLSDWTMADWNYLRGLYLHGRDPDARTDFKKRFLRFGAPIMKPLEIPRFRPRKWETRAAF